VEAHNSAPLDLSLAPYPKGGFIAAFRTVCHAERWNDAVVEVIDLGQRIAFAWTLNGSVLDDLSGWTTKSRVSGVTAVEWILRLNASPEALEK
jgi:hypothetical protein